jgi:hypothetical protein
MFFLRRTIRFKTRAFRKGLNGACAMGVISRFVTWYPVLGWGLKFNLEVSWNHRLEVSLKLLQLKNEFN